VAKQNGAKAKRVMLVRGVLGSSRNLVNSAEVIEELDRLGFQIINPESETPQSIVGKLSEVEMAIAVEGSGQNHCFLAMPRSSTLVTIQPPTRFNAHSKMRADAIGINWGFVVADLDPDGFFLPVDRLLRTIDEVVRRT
jgi:capsular polysaccharide biosynthesis protein